MCLSNGEYPYSRVSTALHGRFFPEIKILFQFAETCQSLISDCFAAMIRNLLGRLITQGVIPGWARVADMLSLLAHQVCSLSSASRFARTRYANHAVFLAAEGSRHCRYQPYETPTAHQDPPSAFASSSQVWVAKISRRLPIRARPQTAKEAPRSDTWVASSHFSTQVQDHAGSSTTTRMSRETPRTRCHHRTSESKSGFMPFPHSQDLSRPGPRRGAQTSGLVM